MSLLVTSHSPEGRAGDPAGELAPIVALVGPESTGKTTLAQSLARDLDAVLVTEFAREYLERARLDGRETYTEADLHTIARTQWANECSARRERFVVADTDLLVMAIWWREKYARVPAWIDDCLRTTECRKFYLLCRPDLPWEEDPLRESRDDLARLFTLYEGALEDIGMPYAVVEGRGARRIENARRAVSTWLNGLDPDG